MKKTLFVGLIALLVGSSLTFAGFTSAKQESNDKSENSQKEIEMNSSDKSLTPQDLRFSIAVNQNGTVKIQGKVVSSPSVATAANFISVQSWLGTYTVNIANAKVIYRYGGTGSVSDIRVGDMIVLDGSLNQNDTVIIAKLIRDLSVWSKNVEKTGIISNVDVSSRTFVLTLPSPPDKDQLPTTIKVIANTDARIRIGDTVVSFASLTNGMKVKVSGLYNSNTQTISARKIDAKNTSKPIPTTSSATSTAQ